MKMVYKKELYEGKDIWNQLTEKYLIDINTVTVVLAGDNESLDIEAINQLPFFVKRKRANRAIILTENYKYSEYLKKQLFHFEVCEVILDKSSLLYIFRYYCFAFNFDNIAFTFLDECEYNMLGRILSETNITEKEAVSLGVYWLRSIPEETK